VGGRFGLTRLGEFRLGDLAKPELSYQLTHAGLPADFAPIRMAAGRGRRIPPRWSGGSRRWRAGRHVHTAGVRLVTLTGPGGVGKTRLTLAVGQHLPGNHLNGHFRASQRHHRALAAGELPQLPGGPKSSTSSSTSQRGFARRRQPGRPRPGPVG